MSELQSKTAIEFISLIDDFRELHEFMEDEQLDRAMELTVRFLQKPDFNPGMAPKLIVELQALATKFSLSAALYKTIKRNRAGTDENFKKEVYYTVAEALNRLVDAVKYVSKYGIER